MSSEETHAADAGSIAAAYGELGTYERHFNELQSRYRTLTSTWLLGAIAAVGFVLTKDLNVSIERSLLVAAIGLAGSCGVGLMWNLDLMVYHRLLDAVFRVGRDFESAHASLPPIRSAMEAATHHLGVVPKVIFFYLGTMAALLLVALTGLTVWAAEALGWWAVAVSLPSVMVAGYALRWMYLRSCRSDAGSTGASAPKTPEPAARRGF